jgi:carboxypeptidase T
MFVFLCNFIVYFQHSNQIMKRIYFLLVFVLIITQTNAQETYSRVRISLESTEIDQIKALGIEIGNGLYKPGHFIEAEISDYELMMLQNASIEFEVLIPDMTAWYLARYEAEADFEVVRDASVRYPVPQNWELGSMGGFYTYQEILDKLDFMAEQWPDLISVRQPISEINSHQGRPIWWVRISDNPEIEQDKPKVLYTSLIHAREGVGAQLLFYFMLHLLENYDTDMEIKNLVDNVELYFVPAVNPDGYVHNQNNSPNGGGMWRKNRRNNGGSFGVDINRNFGYMWGYDNNGSSPNPSSDTYRGPGPFSEPETDNLRIFAETYDFQIALNYHSYSNLWLYPWGYIPSGCPDDEIFHAHALLMTQDNNYVVGPSSTTIYATNGGSDDWMYGEQETKDAIFAYTPEVGSANDGFWPPLSRIIPLCQENMIANFMAGFLSGNFGKITDNSPTIVSDYSFYLNFDLQRLGFGETEQWEVSIEPLDNNIVAVSDPIQIGYLDILETVSDSIFIALNTDISSGTPFSFVLHLNNGTFTQSDTISKFFGVTSIVFYDNCDTFDKWTSNKWNVTYNSYFTPPGSITDSPSGNYQNNEYNPIVLNEEIDLTNTAYALLSFMAKWDIETGYDYVQLLARSEGSIGWVPLAGKYTKPGSSSQAFGQPVYDGTSDWVLEEVDLTAFTGTKVRLSFVLRSDGWITADGFYFDEMKVTVMDVETSTEEFSAGQSRFMGPIYPNPAQKIIHIPLHFQSAAVIELVDLNGRVLVSNNIAPGNHTATMDISGLEKGLYFVKLHSAEGSQTEKLVVN